MCITSYILVFLYSSLDVFAFFSLLLLCRRKIKKCILLLLFVILNPGAHIFLAVNITVGLF